MVEGKPRGVPDLLGFKAGDEGDEGIWCKGHEEHDEHDEHDEHGRGNRDTNSRQTHTFRLLPRARITHPNLVTQQEN